MSGANNLRPKQAAFVEEYLIDFNGTQAAIRAGYSVKTARKMASENLTKPDIIDALARRRVELAEANEVTPEKVAAEYALMGFANLEDYVKWAPDGITLTASSELPEGATRAVSEITEVRTSKGDDYTTTTIKFKLHDKKGALDSLCRLLGYNAPEKREVAGAGGGPIQIQTEVTSEQLEEYADVIRGIASRDPDGPASNDDTGEPIHT